MIYVHIIYIYIYVYLCVCAYVCVYIYIYMYVYKHLRVSVDASCMQTQTDGEIGAVPLSLSDLEASGMNSQQEASQRQREHSGRTYKRLVVVRHSWSPHADGRLPERWLFRVPVLISQNFLGFEFRHSLSSGAGQSQKIVQLRSRCPSSARESCCLHAGPRPFFHRFCEDCGQQHLLHSMECVYELPGVSLAKLR